MLRFHRGRGRRAAPEGRCAGAPGSSHLVSYHDARPLHPERFYHGLMPGLLASLEPDYEVRSNRESGEGRPDLRVKPRKPEMPGVVVELKVAVPGQKTLSAAIREGLAQIRKGDYVAELRAAGARPVHALVVAFDGKRVRVASASARQPTPSGRVTSSKRTPSKLSGPRRKKSGPMK